MHDFYIICPFLCKICILFSYLETRLHNFLKIGASLHDFEFSIKSRIIFNFFFFGIRPWGQVNHYYMLYGFTVNDQSKAVVITISVNTSLSKRPRDATKQQQQEKSRCEETNSVGLVVLMSNNQYNIIIIIFSPANSVSTRNVQG